MSGAKQHLRDITYRGHLIEVWRTEDGAEVTCTAMDDPISLDNESDQTVKWAIFAARKYVDGWKDAGGN